MSEHSVRISESRVLIAGKLVHVPAAVIAVVPLVAPAGYRRRLREARRGRSLLEVGRHQAPSVEALAEGGATTPTPTIHFADELSVDHPEEESLGTGLAVCGAELGGVVGVRHSRQSENVTCPACRCGMGATAHS